MSGSGNTPTNPVPAPRRRRKPKEPVECAAVVSKHSSAILRVTG